MDDAAQLLESLTPQVRTATSPLARNPHQRCTRSRMLQQMVVTSMMHVCHLIIGGNLSDAGRPWLHGYCRRPNQGTRTKGP
eukprot:1386089-Amorphochlora_amoeboformis.AAC.1